MDDDSGSGSGGASMTIDFLRARLLSERSVSRSARQRADELAKRVVELEEQLKFISLQRKKAEKATSDVLAILELNHLSLSEEDYDFDSDSCGSQLGSNNNNLIKDDQISLTSNQSLPWKTTKHTTHRSSVDKKYMTTSSKTSTTYSSSSPKHRSAKSCRQVRRRETRMEESRAENIEAISSSEGTRNGSESGTQLLGEGSEIMERALEQQAQLIGRYEDEEKAQRDWEDRFRESNSSQPDSCEPGNQSDITEERDEIKTRVSDQIPPNDETAKSGEIEVKEAQTIFQPPAHTCESQVSDCMVNEKQAEAQLQNQTPPFISSSNAIVPHKPVGDFGSVLEALKQAKLSLQHRLDKLPSLEGSSVGTVGNPAITKSETKMEIPVGCANLFRVPSDSELEATFSKPNPYSKNRSSVSNNDQYLPFSNGSSVSNNDQYLPFSNGSSVLSNPYLESKHAGERYMEARLNEGFISIRETAGSRISSQRQFVDPYIRGIPPASSSYAMTSQMAERGKFILR